MKLPYLAAAGLLASLGAAQAQPINETPGLSRDAARPTMPPRPGTDTPAGVIQGAIPPTGQGSAAAAQGTVPVAPPPGRPPQGEVTTPGTPAQSGLAPGDRARDALGMGAGRPGTSMPPGSIAGQAPGMGATPQGARAPGATTPATTPGAAAPGTTTREMIPGANQGTMPGATQGTTGAGATSGAPTPGAMAPGTATPGAPTLAPGATAPTR